MVQWGEKRLQVEALRSRILEMAMTGLSLSKIHKQLTASSAIDMPLRTFRYYAAEIRNEAHQQLRRGGGPKILTPDFSRNTEPPARQPRKRAAGRSGQSRPGPTPASSPSPDKTSSAAQSSSFVIEDVFTREFGDDAD